MQAFGRMPAVRTPEALQNTRLGASWSSASPLRDRVDCFDHDRFRGYDTVHFRSGLLPPCLRFAVYVTGDHARLGARLLARLCRGRHLRRLTSIRLQGATLAEPKIDQGIAPLSPAKPLEQVLERSETCLCFDVMITEGT